MQKTQSENIQTKVFEHRSIMPTTLEAMMNFHAQPEALPKLTPFPIIAQLLRDDRVSLTAGELEFRLWFAFIPVRWLAQHEAVDNEAHAFADRMLEGPMAFWLHQHIFKEVPEGVELIDRITLAHQSGWKGFFTRLFFDGLPLRFLFIYRHLRTRFATRKG